MKTIALANGGEALVSDGDFASLSRHVWRAVKSKPGYAYACRNEGGRRIRMHREVCPAADGLVVDHINGDTLDNRRENLRAVTVAENNRNITKPTRAVSGHRYIFPHKTGFIVRMTLDGVKRYGGYHRTLGLAIEARDRIAAIVAPTQQTWASYGRAAA